MSVTWCRACGADATGATCAACSWPLEDLDVGPALVGRVVKVGGGLRGKWGVSIDATDAAVSVVIKDGDVLEVPVADLGALDRTSFTGSDLPTASGRLLAVHLAVDRGEVKCRWEPNRPWQAGLDMAMPTAGRRRAAFYDWRSLGLDDHLASLGLTASEQAWHTAVAAARASDVATVVASLEALPPTGYATRIELVTSVLTTLLADSGLSGRAAKELDAMCEPHVRPRAVALAAVLGTSTFAERRDALATLAPLLAERGSPAAPIAEHFAAAFGQGEVPDPGPSATDLPVTRAVALWTRGRVGTALDAEAEALAPLPDTMLDDLIDAGALTAASSRSSLAQGRGREYIKGRLAPAALTIEETHGLGFASEYARRLSKAGDMERLTQFPPGHPDADHYIALLSLRQNPERRSREGLRPAVRAQLETIDAYLDTLADGAAGSPPQVVLDDPTLWRLLRAEAEKGRIPVTTALRDAAPRFATWLDLIALQRSVFAGDLGAVIERGTAMAGQVDDEVVRVEVQNMVAYAHLVRGDAQRALSILGQAMQGHHTADLVVNAAVVASELGSESAAVFLAEIYDTAEDRSVGLGALMRALDVWYADADSQTLPEPVRRSMRSALSGVLDDDLMLRLLRTSQNHDRTWLATEAVCAPSSAAQQDLVTYWQTLARALTPDTGVLADDVATVLVGLNQRTDVPAWAATELKSFVDMLDDAVHTEFGEGRWTSQSIRILAASGLLPAWQETVLLCQAGAHVAVGLQEDLDDVLSPDAERTYLFEPYERWRFNKGDLPPKLIESVDDEVNRCMAVAGFSLCLVAGRRFRAFISTWQSLVERERWDVQNRYTILRLENEALDEITEWIEHLGRYAPRVDTARLNDNLRPPWEAALSDLSTWRTEVARLRALM